MLITPPPAFQRLARCKARVFIGLTNTDPLLILEVTFYSSQSFESLISALDDGSLMARPQDRKRQRAGEPSQHDHQAKRPRRAVKHADSWRYPPVF
jgi:hypothetical protein